MNLNWAPAELKEARTNAASPRAESVRAEDLALTRCGAYRQERIALAVGDHIRATVSRARGAIKIYTDDTQGLHEAANRDRKKANPSDLLRPEPEVIVESPLKRRALHLRRLRSAPDRTGVEPKQITPRKEKGYGYGR